MVCPQVVQFTHRLVSWHYTPVNKLATIQQSIAAVGTLTLAGVIKSVCDPPFRVDTKVYHVLFNCLEQIRSYGPEQTNLMFLTMICDLDFSRCDEKCKQHSV